MNVAYIFTFFLVILVVLFLLMPFLRQDKSTFTADPDIDIAEEDFSDDIPLDLGREEVDFSEVSIAQKSLAEYEIEIEVAVKKARQRKSTFSYCSQCGHRMQPADRFCAACGHAR